jgi:hypothetical protein
MIRYKIDIGENECNLFRRPEAGEESKLVIVALSFTPVPVNGSDERFGVMHAKRIDLGAVLLFQARASKTPGRIVLLGVILIAEIERATKDTDGIVVRFLAPGLAVRNCDKSGVPHLMEEMFPERGTPHTVQDSSIRAERRCRQVVTGQPTLTMREEPIEDFAARSNLGSSGQPSKEAVVRKLLGEGERAGIDLVLDLGNALASAAQIGFRRRTLDRGAVPDTLEREVELDSAVGRRDYPTRKPHTAHLLRSRVAQVGA